MRHGQEGQLYSHNRGTASSFSFECYMVGCDVLVLHKQLVACSPPLLSHTGAQHRGTAGPP